MRGTLISKTWEWNPALYAPARYRRACKYEAFLPDPVRGIDFALAAGVAGAVSEAETVVEGTVSQPASLPDISQMSTAPFHLSSGGE